MANRNIDIIFSENIRNLLAEKGVTALEFANELKISPSTVSMWLNQKSLPRMDLIDKVANYFDVDACDLLLDSSQKKEMIEGFKKGLFYSSIDSLTNSDEFTKEEIEEIKSYIEFIKFKRTKQKE